MVSRVCTLAIYFRCSPAFPVVIAANRDEFYARPTAEPSVVAHDPWVVAGQDLQAGGTWFGVNEHRMVVGILNRRTEAGPDPTRGSRGLLCLEALQRASPDDVMSWIAGCRAEAFNPFNLLVASETAAFVVTNDGNSLQINRLPIGLHLLTNLDLNDPTCPRIATSHRLLADVPIPATPATDGTTRLLGSLQKVLASHDVPLDPRSRTLTDTLCIHSDSYGTRSSSIVLTPPAPSPLQYWHAPGSPCATAFARITLPN
jgi:uncharacterized protein with NRDE domain